jgi:PAT family beta-lactamase induction signal transducer AmpG
MRKFLKPNLLFIFALGFASGMPLALTTSTLRYWLTEAGIDLSTIGLASLLGLPYILKPLWAPFLDRLKLPYLTQALGLRRSWLLVVQCLLALSIALLGMQNPQINLSLFFMIALAVAFFSATQDDIIDAFRIEILKDDEQGIGASYTQFGYRVAMLFSSAVTLTVAEMINWQIAHFAVAIVYLPFLLMINYLPEPELDRKLNMNSGYFNWFKQAFIMPFLEFSNRKNWALILIFVVLYKLGDSYLGAMTPSFIKLMGYSKTEYALVVKTYGFIASLLGIAVGGIIYNYLSLKNLLIACCVLQSLSNLMFIWPLYSGHNLIALGVTNFIEVFVGVIGSTVFVIYASLLCNRQFTATQYALLSALASIGRVITSSSAGYMLQLVDWQLFIVFSAMLSIPAIMIIPYVVDISQTKPKYTQQT